MRASTNIGLKERSQLVLTDFRGVDFSSSPLRVQSNRASDMANFINEYGANKKRNGWRELFKIEVNHVSQQINGIFWYNHQDHKEMLVHAGKRFYRIKHTEEAYEAENITLSATYAPAKCDPNLLKDQRSQAFFNKGKCYIVGCGDFLVYGSWDNGETYELRRVANNEDTYIPTTTISIDDDTNETDIRSTMEDVNLLSSMRKNQLLGRAFKEANAEKGEEAETSLTWTLDSGSIDENTSLHIVLDTLEGTTAVSYQIENNAEDKTKLYKTFKDGEAITAELCGSVDFTNGKITLTTTSVPQIEGRDNITVTFECAVEGYIDRIRNCSFGILFGVNGNTDRLFLSGNTDFANIDFYSEAADFTYFSDRSNTIIGSDSSAIIGFARLSDSTLAIYKDENSQDANIFYQTGAYETEQDELGNPVLVAKFNRFAGNMGESVISRCACANFGGDSIILSQNGVFGIVLAENVATTERNTRERSRSINERLKTHSGLSEAVGIVYKNRYHLAVDGVCYVADARFKFSSEEDLNGSYNYEWWYWENIPAYVWACIDDELYFGCKDGRVCVFDEKYSDRTYQQGEAGDLAIDISTSEITYNQNLAKTISENDTISFSTKGLYELLLNDCSVSDGEVAVEPSELNGIYGGLEIYADNVEGSGLVVDTKYYVGDVDRGKCTFSIVDEEYKEVFLASGGFRLHRPLTGRDLYVTEVTNTTFKLKAALDEEGTVAITKYNDAIPSAPVAKFTHKQNVVARWITPIFDLGTNEASKTMLKMVISTDPEVNGKISFGYETKSSLEMLHAQGVSVFSFADLSFDDFSFDTGFASSYAVRTNVRNFNFIVFRFMSDNEADCVINNFTVVYKINKSNRGVR